MPQYIQRYNIRNSYCNDSDGERQVDGVAEVNGDLDPDLEAGVDDDPDFFLGQDVLLEAVREDHAEEVDADLDEDSDEDRDVKLDMGPEVEGDVDEAVEDLDVGADLDDSEDADEDLDNGNDVLVAVNVRELGFVAAEDDSQLADADVDSGLDIEDGLDGNVDVEETADLDMELQVDADPINLGLEVDEEFGRAAAATVIAAADGQVGGAGEVGDDAAGELGEGRGVGSTSEGSEEHGVEHL